MSTTKTFREIALAMGWTPEEEEAFNNIGKPPEKLPEGAGGRAMTYPEYRAYLDHILDGDSMPMMGIFCP
jgi:hypothetical protein